jgi:hypothetical protein
MMKLPWQGKETKTDQEVFIATKSGECVGVNHMTLTEVGFYAQSRGKLTNKHYKCATIFVDRYSHLSFVDLQLDDGSVKTLADKLAFKQHAAKHGVKIMHYHCNKGCFHDNAF